MNEKVYIWKQPDRLVDVGELIGLDFGEALVKSVLTGEVNAYDTLRDYELYDVGVGPVAEPKESIEKVKKDLQEMTERCMILETRIEFLLSEIEDLKYDLKEEYP
jgi:hypothetical protein